MRQPRRLLGRIDAQDIRGRSVQTNETEILRLTVLRIVIIKQYERVARIIPSRIGLIERHEADIRIGGVEQWNKMLGDPDGEPASVDRA